MKNTRIWSLLLCSGLFFLSSCTFHQSVIPAIGVGDLTLEALDSSEYRIVDNVKGTAQGGHFLFWSYGDASIFDIIFDIKRGSFHPPTSTDRETGVYDQLARDPAISTAIYNAIESSPNADSLILPKVKKTSFNAFLWGNWQVEVEGKAIEITKDAR